MFAYFLDVSKAFDKVWIDGMPYKLFSQLGVRGKMFAVIKALYTDVQSILYFNGCQLRLSLYIRGLGKDTF